jgi:hypothetical protein
MATTDRRRYLVVANQTLGGAALVARLRQCVAEGPCEFHVLVPANIHEGWIADEDSDAALAHQRLDQALTQLRGLGAEVSGEVGDVSPVDAINDVLRRSDFDEIILSTLPPGVSRWLRLDLPSRVERSVSIPVTHVVATDEPARAH